MSGLRERVLQEIEDAKRFGVKPTAQVWSVTEWIAGDRAIIQIADNVAWCQKCGSLMVVPRGDWEEDFRCATC